MLFAGEHLRSWLTHADTIAGPSGCLGSRPLTRTTPSSGGHPKGTLHRKALSKIATEETPVHFGVVGIWDCPSPGAMAYESDKAGGHPLLWDRPHACRKCDSSLEVDDSDHIRRPQDQLASLTISPMHWPCPLNLTITTRRDVEPNSFIRTCVRSSQQ